jgi:competence protein ComEA
VREPGAFAPAPQHRLRYGLSDRTHSGTAASVAKEAAMKDHSRTIVQALIASLLPAAAWAGPVNVNSADANTLARELDGIGPAKAQAIVEYRQKNGPFRSAEDLLKVQGIGQKVLDQNKANIRLDKAGTAQPSAAKPAARN